MIAAPTFADVQSAASRLRGHAHRTPVLRSATADARLGAQLFFKCENFQRMGAFKFRGAFNALSQFTPQQKQAGVVTFSSGNHAQAIALSARILGIAAAILMPQDAPQAKIDATRGYLGSGGEIILYDRYTQDREVLVADLAARRGMTLIPPYDHPHVIAGQGTAALELFEECGALDALFVCLGGGGLLSGSALAARAMVPSCKVIGVEPEAGNDGQQAFRTGAIVHIPVPRTIADGAQTQHLGQYTFEVIRRDVDDIVTVTDGQLVDAMRFYAQRMKLVVEPTGCLSLAAALQAGDALKGQRVGILVSGGNVDLARYAQLLTG
ncbi:MAG: threo-3-hydroxy-L-aspartate ammonia-lyase [Ramlibacter sp.]|jgi:threonine dehydratase|nr:threo-3-hydroxy-L-aspartate ammonia-lyase [Ramlibacter sp.]